MELSIAQIIKYEGDNSTFVWKHPSEDFNTSTQLIVHESQEAIFFILALYTSLFRSQFFSYLYLQKNFQHGLLL